MYVAWREIRAWNLALNANLNEHGFQLRTTIRSCRRFAKSPRPFLVENDVDNKSLSPRIQKLHRDSTTILNDKTTILYWQNGSQVTCGLRYSLIVNSFKWNVVEFGALLCSEILRFTGTFLNKETKSTVLISCAKFFSKRASYFDLFRNFKRIIYK